MNRKTCLKMAPLTLIVAASVGASIFLAPSNIDPLAKFSWSENAGWMNWADANGGTNGVFVAADHLSGSIWMENVGWLNVGNGGGPYANTDDTDYGVNILLGGNLSGYAWGENIGWVNFDTSAQAPNQARFDAGAGRFRGYAWAENIGWINLDDSANFVATSTLAPPVPAPAPFDRLKNRYISFNPNNGLNAVAFLVTKTSAPAGSCWVQAPVAAGAHINTARCDANPVFRVWSEPVIHVGDCEIIPVADYQVSATSDGVAFSSALPIGTIPVPSLNSKLWGDTVGSNNGVEWTPPNQFTNVQDVLAIQAYISAAAVIPLFTVANLQAISSGDSCLNAFINTADVLIVVRAAAGDAYSLPATTKITDPALCPVCP